MTTGKKASRKKPAGKKKAVEVAIIMGGKSDWPTMQQAALMLEEFGIRYEAEVVSAHRTPARMVTFAEAAESRGLRVIIAGAGGAAHLPGMVAALTHLPVLGVPVRSSALNGLDSLLSIAQMPAGIPVACFSVGEAGAKNAALFAVALLALDNPELSRRLQQFRSRQTRSVLKDADPRK